MKKIYLFLAGLILFFNSQSQINQFTDSLMYGGKIQAYAKNSNCVLVATNGGIFKTTNAGQSWSNATLTFDPNTVNCKRIVSIGNDFYAMSDNSNGSSIYKSNDNGSNWSALSFINWWPQTIGKLSNTLYTIGGDITGGRLYSTIDGSSWTPKALIWDNVWQGGYCELLSFNQNKLYISFNNNLYYTTDGNIIDTIKSTGLSSTNFSEGDNKIDGDASGNLYYSENNAIYKYNFISKSWSDISTGQITSGYQLVQYSVTDNAIFVVAMHNTLGMKLYKSINQGSTFTELTSTGISLPMIGNIIEVSSTNFIGNWLDERILISSNGGNNWSSNSNQYIATSAGNLTLSGNTLLYSREIKGIVKTFNQGVNWNTANNGIPGFSGIAYFVNEMIQVKDTLFSWAQPDPYTNQSVLYKSSDNGNSWSLSPLTTPFNTGEDYAFAGKCDSALFISYFDISTSDYALIASYNNGTSWVKPNSVNSSSKIYLKGPKNCLFAFYSPNNNSWEDFTNVSKANNFGSSFTDLNTGNLFNSNFLIKRIIGKRGDKGGVMMDYDVSNNKAIFAVRDRTNGNGTDKLYLHNMSSNAWSEIITTGLPLNFMANSIKYKSNNVWLLATNSGLYKSTDGGVSWIITHSANSWQNGIIVNSIQVIGNKVFLGTLANGVWVVDLNVGILEQFKENDLQIFPNPASGFINVIIPDFDGKTASFALYNIDGKEIMKKNVSGKYFQLDLQHLSSGSYFLILNSNNNYYKKMIIRK